MAEKLTKKQTEVLQYIKKYVVKYGYAPTVREICNGLGLSSPATIHSHLAQLQKKGMITKGKGKFRTLEVIGENEFLNKKVEVIKVPLLSMDSKKNPLDEIDSPKKLFSIPVELVSSKKNIFAVNVTGTNLVNGINVNDVLIVHKVKSFNNNDTVVYINNDNKLDLWMYDENNLLDSNLLIMGKVIGLFRNL